MTMPSNPQPPTPNHVARPDYDFLRELLRREIGYELGPDREYLVQNRLVPVAASFELTDVAQLVAKLRGGADRRMQQAVVEAMTIQETSFFRGGQRLFDTLARDIIPRLLTSRATNRRLRIWCAACATGQEPYSLAMTFADQCPQLRDWSVEIVATDVSERALSQARRGTYNQFEVQRGLPVQSLLRHFTKTGDAWQIAPELQRRIVFQRHNLLDSLLFLTPPFDLVFLRNVLIYFDAPAKTELLTRVRQAIAADGALVLGETESVLGLTDRFELTNIRDYYHPR